MFCRQGTPVIEIIPHVCLTSFPPSSSPLFAPLMLFPQHMLTTPVTQLFYRVATAMKLRHQSYVVASSSVERAGRCSLDCMRLDAVDLASVAQSVLSHGTGQQ